MRAALQGPTGRITLGAAQLTMGRTADNQLVVPDPKASSHHAIISQSHQGYTITDLGSTNGTYINEQRLEANVPRMLYPGERIRIGDTSYTYEDSAQAASPLPPAASANPFDHTAYGAGNAQAALGSSSPSYPPSPPAYPPAPQPAYPSMSSGQSNPNQGGYLPPPPPAYGAPVQQPFPPVNAGAPAYGAPQSFTPVNFGSPAYSAPTEQAFQPIAQPAYGQQGFAAPSYAPAPQIPPYTPPSAPQQKSGGARIGLIILVVVLVLALGGGGIAAYMFVSRPQPTISVTSTYKVGTTPAGSTSTTFHITGQKFSKSSAITFLLDGTTAPGTQSAQSDPNGNVSADLTITDGWSVGDHQLSAKDASGYAPKIDQKVTIVAQGQAHTPGPHGAPSDDASFTINVNIQAQNAQTGATLSPYTETLIVTGKPDPAGGTVCRQVDDGQAHTYNGSTNSGLTYNETMTRSCTGTYKAGKISFTENVSNMTITYSDVGACQVQTPFVNEQMSGTFNSATAINGGTYSSDTVHMTCADGKSYQLDPEKGTWDGTASMTGSTST